MTKKTIFRTGFQSDIDTFLQEFDKNHPQLSASKAREIQKHQKIFAKRDKATEEEVSPLWKGF